VVVVAGQVEGRKYFLPFTVQYWLVDGKTVARFIAQL
jgi:hypothetical protein